MHSADIDGGGVLRRLFHVIVATMACTYSSVLSIVYVRMYVFVHVMYACMCIHLYACRVPVHMYIHMYIVCAFI